MGCGSVTKAQNMMNVGRSSHSRESVNWAAAAAAKIINFFLKRFGKKAFVTFLFYGEGEITWEKSMGKLKGDEKFTTFYTYKIIK